MIFDDYQSADSLQPEAEAASVLLHTRWIVHARCAIKMRFRI
jgi:hypothetical protein